MKPVFTEYSVGIKEAFLGFILWRQEEEGQQGSNDSEKSIK